MPQDLKAARTARTQMESADTNSPQQHTAAQALVRSILGGQTLPPQGWNERRPQLEVLPNVTDPRLSEAFSLFQRDYPNATKGIEWLGQYNQPDDTQGVWNGLGALHVRGGPQTSTGSMLSTFAHELAHQMGLPDKTAPGQPWDANRDLTAYDVGTAWDRLHSDVNLPAPKKGKK